MIHLQTKSDFKKHHQISSRGVRIIFGLQGTAKGKKLDGLEHLEIMKKGWKETVE